MLFFISLLSLLLTPTRGDVLTPHVRTHAVLAHLDTLSIPIDWRPLAPNMSLATFPAQDWTAWEHDILAATLANDTAAPDHDHDLALRDADASADNVICYATGTSARSYVLSGLTSGACLGFDFVGKVGIRQVVRFTDQVDEFNNIIEVYFAYIGFGRWAGGITCSTKLQQLIDEFCRGETGSMKGGKVTSGDAEFEVDPERPGGD